MLIGSTIIRENDHIQVFFPDGNALLRATSAHVVRQFFPVYVIVVGNDLTQKSSRLSADIAFPVGQQIIQKMDRKLFLVFGHISEVF